VKLWPVGQLAVAAALLCILCGCTPSQQCGTWAFSGSTSGNPFTSSVNSAFTFNPADCSKSCNAQIDAMIQMIRVYDLSNETFVYPSSAYYARENPSGWSIDQSDGWAYAYYGLNNDGTTFDSGFNQVGSNGKPNTLYDGPYGQPPNSEFWAADVAVCFKSDTCQNKIAGIYFWGFSVDPSGNASQIGYAPGWTGLEAEFQTTVTAWNKWAPASGPEAESTTPPFPVPGQPTLPTAVPLPALSDL
jgi:hypothetical protein